MNQGCPHDKVKHRRGALDAFHLTLFPVGGLRVLWGTRKSKARGRGYAHGCFLAGRDTGGLLLYFSLP